MNERRGFFSYYRKLNSPKYFNCENVIYLRKLTVETYSFLEQHDLFYETEQALFFQLLYISK